MNEGKGFEKVLVETTAFLVAGVLAASADLRGGTGEVREAVKEGGAAGERAERLGF